MHMLSASKLGALGVLLSDAEERAAGDLSPSAAALLLALRYRRGATATALAGIAGIAQPTAARVLEGLIRRGLIVRQARTGRTAPLRLTHAGKRRAQALQAQRLSALDRLLAAATTSRAFAWTTCRLCDHAACDGPLCPVGTRATELERAAEAGPR